MREQETSGFVPVDGLLSGDQLIRVTASIGCGSTEGCVWIAEDTPFVLLWDQDNNVFYLDGELPPEGVQELHGIVATTIQPAAMKKGLRYFNVRPLAESL